MGLFNLLFNLSTNITIDNVELAEELFNTLGIGVGSTNKKYDKLIKKIQKECTNKDEQYPDRQKILLKVIELVGKPDTPKQRYLLAISYAWSRANYRKEAITYLTLYLNNDLYDQICKIYSSTCNLEEGTKKHLTIMYDYLGKAYLGEYEFQKALDNYEYVINKYPDDPLAYIGKCESLIKQNRLQECKKWLMDCKKLPYYKLNKKYSETEPENWFYFTINKLLKDVKEKMDKGYIYKPRKRKK